MRLGKLFCYLGGILVLVSTYFLTFGQFFGGYFYGLGFIINLGDIFTLADSVDMIIAIVLILFLLSGFLVLLGLKSRISAIIGSLLAISVGLYFILIQFVTLPPEVIQYAFFFLRLPLVDGIIPFHVAIGVGGLGTYVLFGGGIIGLIGGIIGTADSE